MEIPEKRLSRSRSVSAYGHGRFHQRDNGSNSSQQHDSNSGKSSRKSSLQRKISLPSNFRKRNGSSKFKPIFEGVQTLDPWDEFFRYKVSFQDCVML